MLTDAECDKFLAYLDAKTAEEEAAKHANKITDPLAAVRHEVASHAFRYVALRIVAENITGAKMDNNPSITTGPHDVGANADG